MSNIQFISSLTGVAYWKKCLIVLVLKILFIVLWVWGHENGMSWTDKHIVGQNQLFLLRSFLFVCLYFFVCLFVLPLKITGFALQIFSKLSGTETGSPEPTIGDEAGPTKAECGRDDRLPPSKIVHIILLEKSLIMISSKKSYSASS